MNSNYYILLKFIFISLILSPCIADDYTIIDDGDVTNIYKPKKDKSYKTSITKRKITITSKLTSKEKFEKIMYLTFDDGPLLGSDNIITVLQEEDVQATMFMVGKHINISKYRKKTYQRAIKEPLILVANHTYTHANGRYKEFYSDKTNLLLDLQRMDDLLRETNNRYIMPYCRLAGRNVFRLPKVCFNDPGIPKRYKENSKYDALWNLGYHIFGWDYQWAYDPNNGKVNYSPARIVRNIESIYKKSRTKKKGKFVLLMHDFCFRDKYNGKNQLRDLIGMLKENGWKFETLDTYM
jgi:peptidoglycan/xylan/chitin deacetylase (PgdA/CDA1 family)